jgi:dolichol-phosphate mannosyltransferase
VTIDRPLLLARLTDPRVLFLLVAATGAWLCLSLPVFSQEAYYWTYSQHPDLSYFDHPPMVAWLIWLGTSLFGDGAWGIRFGTWVCSLLTTACGLALLRSFGVDGTGRRIWLLLALTVPILTMTHFLANPDGPLVCFSSICLLALWRAREGSFLGWIVAGVTAGAALLSKYTAVYLAVGGIIVLLLDRPMRRQLLRPGPWLGVLLAAAVFSPVVIWNWRHDFVSFRFQTQERYEHAHFGARYTLELLGDQFLLLNPALAVLLLFAAVGLARRALGRDARALWVLAFGLPLPLYMYGTSLWIHVKMNWLVPAYVPLLLGTIAWVRETGFLAAHPRATRWIAGCLLLAATVLIPLAPLIRLLPATTGSSWTGWDEIALRAEQWEEKVDTADGVEGNMFFFAADYKDASQLSRALKLLWRAQPATGRSEQGEPTLAQNVFGMRALQYDEWSDPGRLRGQDAIFVLPRPSERQEMLDAAKEHFQRLELVEHVEVKRLDIVVLEADLYVGHGYLGPSH